MQSRSTAEIVHQCILCITVVYTYQYGYSHSSMDMGVLYAKYYCSTATAIDIRYYFQPSYTKKNKNSSTSGVTEIGLTNEAEFLDLRTVPSSEDQCGGKATPRISEFQHTAHSTQTHFQTPSASPKEHIRQSIIAKS